MAKAKKKSGDSYRYQKRQYPNLQLRRRRWYAILEIPRDLQMKFGRDGKRKQKFVASLETESLSKARERLPAKLAQWRMEIAEALGSPEEDDAEWYRRALAGAKTAAQRQVLQEAIEREADDVAYANMDWNKHQRPSQVPEAEDFYKRATGSKTAFMAHLEEWLAQSTVTEKTKSMQRSDVQRFAKVYSTVEEVERKNVQTWVRSLPVKPKTILRILGALRGYWRYLQSVDAAPRDAKPFNEIELPKVPRKRTEERLPFKPEDIVKLMDEVADAQLCDLIELARYSGCRIEELCALKREDVAKDHFRIIDSKTAAGVREVPIHPALKTTVWRLKGDSRSGYLIDGLSENKFGYRSDAIGKKFGRLKTSLGFDGRFVFHSIRKTVATLLEDAGVPENVAADILGHEKQTMTYGLYSGGTSLKVKAVALAKVGY